MDDLKPRDHREAVAHFRLSLIGDLAHRELSRGELRAELGALSQKRFRPPGAKATRRFGVSTLERWLYAFKRGGLAALHPAPRTDRGRGRGLNEELRALLLDIRREHRSASAQVIVSTLEDAGLLDRAQVTPTTVRRFFNEHDLPRLSKKKTEPTGRRLRWQAEHPNALWQGDVCHLPAIEVAGQKKPVRIHALIDDCSRYIVGIEAHHHEREIDMLGVFVRALRRHGAPDALYLDNGSTYRGETLEVACRRMEVSLIHPPPRSPESRGKIERFFRSLREGCTDFLGSVASLHDINVRLWAFVDERYHTRPHAGLFGQTPASAFRDAQARSISEERLRTALTVRVKRRIRTDSTLSVEGKDFQVDQRFLAGKVITVGYCMLDEPIAPWVEHHEVRYPLEDVDPVKNGRTRRPRVEPEPPAPHTDFDPAGALLEHARRRIREENQE